MTVYTLFQQAQTTSFTSLGGNLTVTTEFTPKQNVALSAIWYYSPSGATALPTQVGIFSVASQALLASNTSPSWSGAAGSGWIKATLSTPILLQSGQSYLAAVFLGNANVGGKQTVFWTTGPGANGFSNAVMSAPDYAATTVQGMVQSGTAGLTYPTVTESGSWYGVDVEVNDTFRLFPSTNGPANATSYSGNFISGLVFAVQGGGTWFEGYWWWVSPGSGGTPVASSTAPVKCALWSSKNTGNGVLVPGSVVTSGTLTAGAWNYIPLPTPIQLAPTLDSNQHNNGSSYVAAIGCNGNFPDTNSFWSAPIQNGPLFAYDGTHTGAALGAPYSQPQGVFSTAGADPSTTYPQTASGSDNFWVDVQVSSTPPAGYTGSYRLWPNKADTNQVTSGDAAVNYTIGTEIHLSQTCDLNYIWYYSPNFSGSTATTLATRADVWDISSGLSVASITSPTWLTPTGGAASAGTGWVKAALPAGTSLPAGSYRVTVYNANGTTDQNWGPKDANTDYWGETNTGAGSIGITSGPLSAPNWANASPGYLYNAADGANTPPYGQSAVAHAQPPFGQLPGGGVDFPQLFAPVGTNNTQNYWVDLEVTPITTYTVFGQPASPATVQADATEYTLTMEFTVSQTSDLTGIWFYSPSGAGSTGLPVACGVFQKTGAGTGTLIASNTSPVWSGAVGSGWIRCSFPGTTTLTPGNTYKVAVAGANASDWYSATANYFTSGPGASGLTSGPLTVPNNAGADVGQDSFFSASQTLTYPASYSGNGPNYWLDVEVTTSGSPSDSGSGGMALPKMKLAGAGSLSGGSTSGTGAAALPKMKLAGAGGLSTSGSGGVKLPKMALYGGQGVQINAVQWIAWDVLTSVTAEVSTAWQVGDGVQPNMSQMASVPWISTYPS